MNNFVPQRNVPRLLILALLLLLPAVATAQALPPVADFVRHLDVRCYRIPDQPPINVPLTLDHLNPVLVEKGFPREDVVLQRPEQLCVPVRKNNLVPPANVLQFIRYVDWKCYGISGPSLDFPLHLDHLNPVISGMLGPSLNVWVREPQQLCVPVRKNNQFIPAGVLQLIRWLDVKCYRIESNSTVGGAIQLGHLNPLFNPALQGAQIIPPPHQLCVPVAKNGSIPPTTVFNHVAYSDVLCYRLQGQPLNMALQLQHLNPVLQQLGLPVENVFVDQSEELCVPVANNGQIPPKGATSVG